MRERFHLKQTIVLFPPSSSISLCVLVEQRHYHNLHLLILLFVETTKNDATHTLEGGFCVERRSED